MEDVAGLSNDCSVDQPEQPAPSEERGKEEDRISEEDRPITKLVASSFSSLSDLSIEGDGDNSKSTDTAIEPEEYD